MDLQLFHRRFTQSPGLKLCLDEQIWYQSWPKTNTLHAWIPDTIDARYIFSVKIVKKSNEQEWTVFLTLDDSRVLHQLRILEILLTEESDTDITQPYVGLWLCLHSYESTHHPAI